MSLDGKRPYRQVVDEVLERMPDASWDQSCPMCGRTGAHNHTAQESTIYANGVKLGMQMARPKHPNEGKLMF